MAQAELAAELHDLDHRWDVAAAEVEVVAVPLERSDVAIAAACLLWLPVAG